MDQVSEMATFLRTALLTLALFAGFSHSAQSADSDQLIDYAPIMSRGFGVSDEPSLLDQCAASYAAFRIFEHAGGRPIAIVRVEKRSDGIYVTKRRFEDSQSQATTQSRISAEEWTELWDLFGKSGFWTYENDETVWMPDSPTMWIEACLKSQFRSISIYPERDSRMIEIADFLATLGS